MSSSNQPPKDPDDPWVVPLDDEFIKGAKNKEATAKERADKASRIRAEHSKLVEGGEIVTPIDQGRKAKRRNSKKRKLANRGSGPQQKRSGVNWNWVIGIALILLAIGLAVASTQGYL